MTCGLKALRYEHLLCSPQNHTYFCTLVSHFRERGAFWCLTLFSLLSVHGGVSLKFWLSRLTASFQALSSSSKLLKATASAQTEGHPYPLDPLEFSICTTELATSLQFWLNRCPFYGKLQISLALTSILLPTFVWFAAPKAHAFRIYSLFSVSK